MNDILSQLDTILSARKSADADKSYVASLDLIAETADLWFHSLVMLSHLGENADSVLAELARRFDISGLEEKAKRKDG